MTEQQMLRLAAKAAGITLHGWSSAFRGNDFGCFDIGDRGWNPLTDDGDALRLAVSLRMLIEPARTMGGAFVEVHAYPSGRGDCAAHEPLGSDDNAATRRAIVRAAAELGLSMLSDEERKEMGL